MKLLAYDTVVVGGGLAGICAAISAARCRVKVALVQDRPVLGGNASGELTVHIAGADCSGHAIARFVRETGIIDEIRLENLYRNPSNSYDVLSLIMREFVEAELGIDLYLNTRVHTVTMAGPNAIEVLEANQCTTEKKFRFQAKVYIDCTGDGFIGAKAGALFRYGREARDEHNESLAPACADSKTLPSCLLFHLKDMGEPTSFVPPSWAHHYESQDDLPFRSVAKNQWDFAGICGGFWWLSAGGDKSSIDDHEATYKELLRAMMGVWNLIKNRRDYGAANYALDRINPILGKRESRRLEGDYWLNQNDVIKATPFPDRVAYGGWSIDLHPPEGIFSKEPPCDQTPLARPYSIPLRCLYSKNIRNLMFAGRDASFTHVGLGSPRVIATCAVAGQAAGVAAAVAVRENLTARQVQKDHISSVQQILLRQGAYIPDCLNRDNDDLAQQAVVRASSKADLSVPESPDEAEPFTCDLFQLFPITAGRIDSIEIMVEAPKGTEFTAGIRRAVDIWDFTATKDIALCKAASKKAGLQWICLEPKVSDLDQGLYWLYVEADSQAKWCRSLQSLPSLVCGKWETKANRHPELSPAYQTLRGVFIFRIKPASRPFSPGNVTNGVARPEKWTNLWVSAPIGAEPAWLELRWDQPKELREIQLAFDGQFDSNITWPSPLGVFGVKALPTIVKHYELQMDCEGTWTTLATERNNYRQRRVHSFSPVSTSALRIVVYSTNGVPEARLFEVRAYG